MAISSAPVQTRSTSWFATGTTRGVTGFTSNFTVGNKILIGIGFGASTPTSVSISDNSAQAGTANTYTSLGSATSTNTGTFWFYCDITRAILTTDTITVSWTNTAVHAIIISEWSGAKTGAAANVVTNNGTSTSPTTGALTAATAGDLVLGAFTDSAQNAFTVGTDGQGNTMAALGTQAQAQTRSLACEYLVESGTAAYNPAGTWAGSAVNWSAIGVRINAAASAPVNTVAPAVTGNISVGQTLSTTNGTWTDAGSPAFTYAWQRDVAGNSVYSNIGSATASTYVLVTADATCNVRCVVTDTDVNGATPANSNAVGPIAAAAITTRASGAGAAAAAIHLLGLGG